MMTMTSGASARSCSSISGARTFVGWCTGNFAASASSLTGENAISWPRPFGRSGCVNTLTTSKSGCWRRCCKEGTANCGVPQNTIRNRLTVSSLFAHALKLPLALFPQFLDLAPDQVAFQHAQVLQEEHPIQMVKLMAKRARQQI